MRNILLLTILVLFSSNAFAIDIGDLLGISKPAKRSLKKNHVIMNKVSFDIDSDGTWDTCTTKPCSSIKNRADMFDLSQDLMPRIGINRIPIQELMLLQDESGPNGELVYKIINDKFGRMRCVGTCQSAVDDQGYRINLLDQNDFIEVTFWGTGLNLLTNYNGTDDDWRVNIDAGGEGSDIHENSSDVIAVKYCAPNQVRNLTSGLTEGWHTVQLKLNDTSQIKINGFEIINESSNIKTNPGSAIINGKVAKLSSQDSTSYSSAKTGTKGGHVVEYLRSNGSIGFGWQATDSTAQYLSSTDHSNEELIRNYFWREFGIGLGVDFAKLVASNDAAFTLDDGTTGLIGNDVSSSSEMLLQSATTDFIIFTFVGTGLDAFIAGSIADLSNVAIEIDGSKVGNLASSGWTTSPKLQPIASGLSYGTHVVKIYREEGGGDIYLKYLHVYAPKKPTLPSDAIELGHYYIMADFVANDTAGLQTISTGVLRKSAVREMIYFEGTTGSTDWTMSGLSTTITTRVGAYEVYTDRLDATVRYGFFGTGFEFRGFRGTNRSDNIQIKLNGTNASVGTGNNFPTASSFTYGYPGITDSTGVFSTVGASLNGCGAGIKDLPLDFYVVEFISQDSGEYISIDALDIITPIHSPKNNGPYVVQNTLPVGSQSIGDSRVFDEDVIKVDPMSYRGTGAISNITSTSTQPIYDIIPTIYVEKKGRYAIDFQGLKDQARVSVFHYVDGVSLGLEFISYDGTSVQSMVARDTVYLDKGYHTIHGTFSPSSGTARFNGYSRRFNVYRVSN